MANPPFVPTARYKVEAMVELAEIEPGVRTADLGSGDGRIVIAFAQKGAAAHGYELNFDLVLRSEEKIKELGLTKNAHIHIEDFWGTNLSSFDIITVFGMESIMHRLKYKFETELKAGTKVLSNSFDIPKWKPIIVKDSIRLYIVK